MRLANFNLTTKASASFPALREKTRTSRLAGHDGSRQAWGYSGQGLEIRNVRKNRVPAFSFRERFIFLSDLNPRYREQHHDLPGARRRVSARSHQTGFRILLRSSARDLPPGST